MNRDPVVIIGGGLAGLTAGRVLAAAGREYVILEASDRPGGLCRSYEADGYTFDCTGHLLHLKEGESKDLILELVGRRLAEHTRKASVCVRGTLVDYPVQAHFGDLPDPLAGQCLEELREAAGAAVNEHMSFDKWAEKRFGPTLAGLFMIPYNAKLNVHPLDEMEVSWTSWAVPVPSAADLEVIARGQDPPVYGYNAFFFYPREGGIEILPRALALGQGENILNGAVVTGVDLRKKAVLLAGGERIGYARLISTVPLPDLLGMAEGLPSGLRGVGSRLRYSSVLGVCLGLDGPINSRDHWIYFPDRDLPFYRVGFPVNFSDRVAPAGLGSLYAEAAWSGGPPPDPERIAASVMSTLTSLGLVDRSAGVAARVHLAMPCAYVFHDRYRAARLDEVLAGLKGRDVLSVGRYGAWEYSAMQDAVQWGLDAAREALR